MEVVVNVTWLVGAMVAVLPLTRLFARWFREDNSLRWLTDEDKLCAWMLGVVGAATWPLWLVPVLIYCAVCRLVIGRWLAMPWATSERTKR